MWSLPKTCLVFGLTAVLAAGCQPSAPSPSAVDPLPSRGIGVRYGATPDLIEEYEDWLGREMDTVLVFFEGENSDEVLRNGLRVISNWTGSKYDTVVFSAPLAMRDQPLAAVARGANDDLFRQLARALVQADRGDDVIRLGWEFNLDNFAWAAGDEPEVYAKAFRRVVKVMRAVRGAESLRFEWNFGRGGAPIDDRAYPGDAFVDIVGMDVYDRSPSLVLTDPLVRWERYRTGSPGFDWLRDFAGQHGKKIAISEWGVSTSHVAGADPDNPHFIEMVRAFIDANDVAYAIYFERQVNSADHRLMGPEFPLSARRYQELFKA